MRCMDANHNHMCILTSSVTIQGVTEGDLSLIIHFIKFGIILFVVPNYVVEGENCKVKAWGSDYEAIILR